MHFVKLNPTRNMTLLVTSQHPVHQYRPIATELLSTEHVHAEQVGFICTPTSPGAQARLHMAGDEFCGNACMSLAALIAARQDRGGKPTSDIVLDASGAAAPIACRVARQHPGYYCELTMPPPRSVEPYAFPGTDDGRCALVRYRDAVYLVVEAAHNDPAIRAHAQEVAQHLGSTENVSVVGVMLYDAHHNTLNPLIHVPALNTMVWESSCGSGTGSVGAYLATQSACPTRTCVHQPGGTMHVSTKRSSDGRIALRIGGQVRVVAEGTAYVHV